MIAVYLAHHGFNTFVMPMPYQQSRGRDARRARSILSIAAADGGAADRLYEAGAQAVLDAKRVRKWLIRDEKVSPDRVGVVGISLGSLVASVIYSTDPGFRSAALVLGGGDLGGVVWQGSRETIRLKRALISAGKDIEWTRRLLAPLDPLTYANPQRRAGLLMINAADDEVFPRQSTMVLSRAYGEPPIIFLPGNHYTVALYTPVILDRIVKHMTRELLPAEPTTVPAIDLEKPPHPRPVE
jgi:dienelactone hydrolase